MDAILENRTILIFLGGLGGGAIGFVVWRLLHRVLPKPSLWLLVGGLAFVGARLLPDLAASLVSPAEHEQTAPIEGASEDAKQSRLPAPANELVFPLDFPLLASLAAADPHFTAVIEREIGTAAQPEKQVLDFALTHGAQAALDYLPRAADQPILDLAEALALSVQQLTEKDPKACYGWLYGGFGFVPFDFDALYAALGKSLLTYQASLYDAIIHSAGAQIPDYDGEAARAAISAANLQMFQIAGIDNTALITGERAPAGMADYIIACQARFILWQSLLADENAAHAIRELYRQNNR